MSSIQDLPDGCVAHIVHQLRNVQDMLHFQRTCLRFAAIGQGHQAAWLNFLDRDFDIRVAVHAICTRQAPLRVTRPYAGSEAPLFAQSFAPNQGQELYKQVVQAQNRHVRFKGCFTDGGVDDVRDLYWEELDRSDQQRSIMRSYVIKRLSRYATFASGIPDAQQLSLAEPLPDGERASWLKLVAWSTSSLYHAFLTLYAELVNQSPWGQTLLHDVPLQDLVSARASLRAAAHMIQQAGPRVVRALDGGPQAKHALLGVAELNLMRKPALPKLMGVIERVVISTSGEFSCPMQSGMLFMANCNISQWASRPNSRNPEILQGFQATVAEDICKHFNGVTTLQMVCDKVKEGGLVMPVAAHLTANGGWVEFHPSSASVTSPKDVSDPKAPVISALRPLAWFRFSTSQERALLASHLEAEIAMHGRQTEFLHNHELPWWLGDADIHHIADHWRDPLDDMKSFVSSSTNESDLYDPATADKRLNIRLHHRHAGNMLCVKLITSENLMEEHGDLHPRPNVDVNFVATHGKLVNLPEHVQLKF